MRVLFWGTPDFAVPSLQALLQSTHEIVGLVTQPDRPRGRSGRPEPPPTKLRLLEAEHPAPILQPEKPAGAAFRERLAALAPDVHVVAAYGNLLPARVLAIPGLGAVNVHASLLPRYRGAAPVAAALLAGDERTGITLMRMDAGLDTGPILLQRELAIGPDETCGELTHRLARLGAEVLLEGLEALGEGRLAGRPQDERHASHAPRVAVADARLRWEETAEALARAIRAYDPWPGAHTSWERQRVKLFRARAVATPPEMPEGDPGAIAVLSGRDGEPGPGSPLVVQTGRGLLEVEEVQLEGRPRMPAGQFLRGRGRSLATGGRFE